MASSYHNAAREIIKEKYPTLQIIEEHPIKVEKTTYYLDFYLPLIKLAVEVQGSQHYEFSALFHGSQAGFIAQKKRDVAKAEFLEDKGIRLVALKFNEQEKWKDQI